MVSSSGTPTVASILSVVDADVSKFLASVASSSGTHKVVYILYLSDVVEYKSLASVALS